jgi:hypothetical protein
MSLLAPFNSRRFDIVSGGHDLANSGAVVHRKGAARLRASPVRIVIT